MSVHTEDPPRTESELVRVAIARDQPEAELIQNLLSAAGVPSTLLRTAGFDVPELLAAGPRDVLVAASAAEAARDVLLEAGLADRETTPRLTRRGRMLIGLAAVLVVVSLLVALIFDVPV